jgi:hypothetical protein
MNENHHIISYTGYFSYELTGHLIEKLRKAKGKFNLDKSSFRKVLTLMVEVLENNYKYVNKLENKVLDSISVYPTFHLKKENDHFKMTSGNPILKKDIDPLKQRIDLINKLTRDELKELYKDTMSEGIYENQEGAGLGIMKMAKITRNKINYSIDPIKDDIFFYTIEIRIPT